MSAVSDRIIEALRGAGKALSQAEIREALAGEIEPSRRGSALHSLVAQGRVVREGKFRQHRYSLASSEGAAASGIRIEIRKPRGPLALPPADGLRCAMFHDGTVVIDKAGAAMTLEPAECDRLYTFLDQMEAIWRAGLEEGG